MAVFDKCVGPAGSCLGGASFVGLCRLLTGDADFKRVLELSKKVRHTRL